MSMKLLWNQQKSKKKLHIFMNIKSLPKFCKRRNFVFCSWYIFQKYNCMYLKRLCIFQLHMYACLYAYNYICVHILGAMEHDKQSARDWVYEKTANFNAQSRIPLTMKTTGKGGGCFLFIWTIYWQCWFLYCQYLPIFGNCFVLTSSAHLISLPLTLHHARIKKWQDQAVMNE